MPTVERIGPTPSPTAAAGSEGVPDPLIEAERLCSGWQTDEIREWSMARRRRILRAVHRLTETLGVTTARLLAVEEASGDWALSGAKDAAAWRAQEIRSGFGAAKSELELAVAVDEMPKLGQAVTNGAMTLEHAKTVARELGTASKPQHDAFLRDSAVQERMFRAAKDVDAGRFRKAMRLTMAEIDPEKFQRDHDAIDARRFARIRNQAGGVHFEAFLTAFDGRKLVEALNTCAPRPGADDNRTRDQRGADALVSLADAILAYGVPAGSSRPGARHHGKANAETTPGGGDADTAHGLPGANRPHLTVTMSMAELVQWRTRGRFPGSVFDDGTPVPPAQLDALLCDASLMRLVLDSQSRPMDLGHSVRTFNGAYRRALVVRDGGCAWPGCGLSARYTEGHHVQWWSRGGKTTVDNGILLCSRHHHRIHAGSMLIVPMKGGFRFEQPDGTLHGTHTFGRPGAPAGSSLHEELPPDAGSPPDTGRPPDAVPPPGTGSPPGPEPLPDTGSPPHAVPPPGTGSPPGPEPLPTLEPLPGPKPSFRPGSRSAPTRYDRDSATVAS